MPESNAGYEKVTTRRPGPKRRRRERSKHTISPESIVVTHHALVRWAERALGVDWLAGVLRLSEGEFISEFPRLKQIVYAVGRRNAVLFLRDHEVCDYMDKAGLIDTQQERARIARLISRKTDVHRGRVSVKHRVALTAKMEGDKVVTFFSPRR